MTGDRPALWGLLLYLFFAVTPTLLFWAALRLLPAAVTALHERLRGKPPPQGPTQGSTLEEQVANLRRLRRELRAGSTPSQVRQVALQAAYDDTLLAVCALVEVGAPLCDAVGSERRFARLQTEAALEDAGIVIDPPSGGTAAP